MHKDLNLNHTKIEMLYARDCRDTHRHVLEYLNSELFLDALCVCTRMIARWAWLGTG